MGRFNCIQLPIITDTTDTVKPTHAVTSNKLSPIITDTVTSNKQSPIITDTVKSTHAVTSNKGNCMGRFNCICNYR
jgi:hypothetical protein